MKVFDPTAFRELRKGSGHTQRSLGEAIGTVENHVQQWEYGSRAPTATYLLRAMEVFGCLPGELMKEEEEENGK